MVIFEGQPRGEQIHDEQRRRGEGLAEIATAAETGEKQSMIEIAMQWSL